MTTPCFTHATLFDTLIDTLFDRLFGILLDSSFGTVFDASLPKGKHVKELWRNCRASTWDHSVEKTKPVAKRYSNRGVTCATLPSVCPYPKGTHFFDGLQLMRSEETLEWPDGKVVYTS